MATVSQHDLDVHLLGSGSSSRTVTDALRDLLAEDGSVYIVVGFFTYNGFRVLRSEFRSFLDRSPDNTLVFIVGPASDQFSPRIARDLWAWDTAGEVKVRKQPKGLHAKLYLRTGETSHMILGSANLTRVAFEYNVELGIELRASTPSHPRIDPYVEWVEDLALAAPLLDSRDLRFPLPVYSSVVNWTNKAKLLPRQYVLRRITPYAALLVVVAVVFRLI